MSQPFIGEIRMFGGNFAPAGWAFCDGQLMPISQNDAMFTLIGTTYGGDGQETFALPNLQSRLPMHAGNGFVLAEQGGTESVTLTTQQIPIHTHAFLCDANNGAQPTPLNNFPAGTPQQLYVDPSGLPANGQLAPNSIAPTGGSQPHDNMSPYLVISFIISLFGIFPQQT
jgi:microcystin-dependent protein